MIDYRPFRNTDPPALCAIWQNSAALRARYQPLTPSLLEDAVLAKPFFDPQGLIVASEEGRPVGFAHAGFAVTADGSSLDYGSGTTCMLMVTPCSQQDQIARQLLEHSERYLQEAGARQLFAGANPRLAPFYHGLYGGAMVSGILATDIQQLRWFADAEYAEVSRALILQRLLAGFRPVVDRQQMMLKRTVDVTLQPEPPLRDWWEACTAALADRFVYVACPRSCSSPCASVSYWDMEPLASIWAVHARGLCELQVDVQENREPTMLYVLGESLRLLAAAGATLCEAHVASVNEPLLLALQRLGFAEIESTTLLSKP